MYTATFRGELTFRQGASPSKIPIFDNWPANSLETNRVEDSVSFVIRCPLLIMRHTLVLLLES